MLSIHIPGLALLGVSTVGQYFYGRQLPLRLPLTKDFQVHGNTSADDTMKNAARCLHAFGAPDTVKVYPGATQPLLRSARYDPEIHGESGLGGVEGLPSADIDEVRARMPSEAATVRALEGMAAAVRDTWKNGAGSKVTLVSSGPMTNVALFSAVFPELIGAIGK